MPPVPLAREHSTNAPRRPESLQLQLQSKSPADFRWVGVFDFLALRVVQYTAAAEIVSWQEVVGADPQLRIGVDEPDQKRVGNDLGSNKVALNVTEL